ncbi:protein of unknown function [Pseudomonas sp. JV241A]|nr:protein of unknown function [Pseudomonas sp. JV241A]
MIDKVVNARDGPVKLASQWRFSITFCRLGDTPDFAPAGLLFKRQSSALHCTGTVARANPGVIRVRDEAWPPMEPDPVLKLWPPGL